VDELRLRIFPVLLGAGQRLFDDTGKPQSMRLVESHTLDGDTASLTYQRIPEDSRR
jgi:dihydrofolate reductase